MTANLIKNPFIVFTDTDGKPLDAGFIYVGHPGLDAEFNQKSIYSDTALSTPLSQPIKTSGGIPSISGTATPFYSDGDYSIKVKNKKGELVFSSLNENDRLDAEFLTFVQSGAGAISRSGLEKAREVVSAADFGFLPTSSASTNQAAIEAAHAASKTLFIPAGTYSLTGNFYAYREGHKIWGAGIGATIINITGSNPGFIIGNSSSTAENVHSCTLQDMTISGGTYPLQTGSSKSPLTHLGSVARLKLSGGTAGGLYLYQTIASYDNLVIENNAKGIVTLQAGGDPTNTDFNHCRIYQNTDEAIYLETFWGFRFNTCDIETSGKEGVYLKKSSGKQALNITFDNCWFENNVTGGKTNTASIYAEADGANFVTNVNVRECTFNNVNGATNKHIRGYFNTLNTLNNHYITPSANAIEIDSSNTQGFLIGPYETVVNRRSCTLLEGVNNYPNGKYYYDDTLDVTVGAGSDAITATIGNIEAKNGTFKGFKLSNSDGEVTGGYFITAAETGLAARHIFCGSDTDRVAWTYQVASVLNARTWMDNTGILRWKSINPTSATDGTVIGTQTFTGTHVYKAGDADLQIGEAVKLVNRRIYRTTTEADPACIGVFAGKSALLKTSFDEDVAGEREVVYKTVYDEEGNPSQVADDVIIHDHQDPGYTVISLGDTRLHNDGVECLGVLVDCPVVAGDLLCTSSTAGKLTKQVDDIVKASTVAKVVEDGDQNGPVYAYILN
jgi:hypothetical protein